MSEHPRQPIELDPVGVPRFKGNAIVERLSREGSISLNDIAMWDVPIADREQFWQLLGYSVSGYGDLSFVRPETVEWADDEAAKLRSKAPPPPPAPPPPRTSFQRILDDD